MLWEPSGEISEKEKMLGSYVIEHVKGFEGIMDTQAGSTVATGVSGVLAVSSVSHH